MARKIKEPENQSLRGPEKPVKEPMRQMTVTIPESLATQIVSLSYAQRMRISEFATKLLRQGVGRFKTEGLLGVGAPESQSEALISA